MKKNLDVQAMEEFIEGLDGAAILDGAGAYIYVSEGWEQFTGIKASDAIGKKVWDLIPDTHAREVYETGKPVFAQVVHKRGVPAFTSYFPHIGTNGKVEKVFLYILFQGMDYARDLNRRINKMSSVIEYYKEELSRERGSKYNLDSIIGNSDAIKKLKELIIQTANSVSTVLIDGETGCGKELIAHSIHALSERKTANFIRVNCSAIPLELMESEFFGYSAGAFTGANKKGKIGRFELADGGSIFLDEINLLAETMQPKFLSVLQEKEVDPVGGSKSIPVNVRVIAASNIPLEKLVEEGKFRSDLYYRLNVIRIHAPSLRERMEDIPLLVDYFIEKLNHQLGMVYRGISSEALELLMRYDWPGNVRELQNAVESAMNIADGNILRKRDFYQIEQRIRSQKLKSSGLIGDLDLKTAKQSFEKDYIKDVLQSVQGNRTKAAKILGISRTVLYDKMEAYHLKCYLNP